MENTKPATEGRTGPALPILYGSAILLSATLLFLVQPLVAKLLLPLLGGSPSVWNMVMVFFQAMLLAGYAYAHFSFQAFGLRWQPVVHLGLLLLACLALPFAISNPVDDRFQSGYPALWVLLTLLKSIGIPVFVLASTAPLLQKWFSCSRHSSAGDPYFLYAASNFGSFSTLFAYPVLIEPYFRLQTQTRSWSVGFWILAGVIAICGLVVRGRAGFLAGSAIRENAEPVSRWTALKWIGLSFVPSSLMLGVTNYITTDIASVPMLWVLPLALYLFTFVIAFSRHSKKAETASSRAIPILALAVIFPMLVQATEPVIVLVLLHIAFFFFAALQCHLKLANSRPGTEHLTRFYLYMSVGGVLGGIFNALIAPVLFSSIVEYPLMILAATLIGYPIVAARKSRVNVPPVYGGAIIIVLMTLGAAIVTWASKQSVPAGNLLAALLLVSCYLFIQRPVRYTVAVATLLVCTSIFRQAQSRVVERDRNFFGVLRVANEPGRPLRKLYHGTTIHGVQSTNPDRRCQPLSYYHSDGPVADIAALFERTELPANVGLVGLGAGAMITYSRPGQAWTLYEIDPAVVRIAKDTNHFTYLSHCARAPFEIELGDARLRLQAAPDDHFGLLYIDAFSSDVIPMHLLTLEALQLYREKLAPDGILAFHLSSRNFELEPIVAKLGEALGLHCFSATSSALNAAATAEGGFESNWAILVSGEIEQTLLDDDDWERVVPNPATPLWTDDFSSLVPVLRFR